MRLHKWQFYFEMAVNVHIVADFDIKRSQPEQIVYLLVALLSKSNYINIYDSLKLDSFFFK